MYLENLVFDAIEPQRLGAFWEAALGSERLTDEPEVFETRLAVDGGPVLDLCFQRVATPPADPQRLHLDLLGDTAQDEVVERLRGLGAAPVDIGQGDVPWVVLADPEGNPFCVMEERDVFADTGPIAALPLDSADRERDTTFWAWLTSWVATDQRTLRHPSLRGPLLEFCTEHESKTSAKNRLHLDVRLEPGEDADDVAAQIVERGGSEWRPQWANDVPWRLYHDPSGNEFCVLPASSAS